MIYLIHRVGYDSLENRNPEVDEIIGYVDTELEAKEICDKLSRDSKRSIAGWNGVVYPRFYYESVNHI